MPAHSGVWLKLYPCSGSQMPCSQMISMNCMPPRPIASIRFAILPARERADLEQRDPEQRLGDPGLDVYEGHEQGQAAEQRGQHPGTRPPHGMAAVGQQAVG